MQTIQNAVATGTVRRIASSFLSGQPAELFEALGDPATVARVVHEVVKKLRLGILTTDRPRDSDDLAAAVLHRPHLPARLVDPELVLLRTHRRSTARDARSGPRLHAKNYENFGRLRGRSALRQGSGYPVTGQPSAATRRRSTRAGSAIIAPERTGR